MGYSHDAHKEIGLKHIHDGKVDELVVMVIGDSDMEDEEAKYEVSILDLQENMHFLV